VRIWFNAARPRTLPAAIAPVLVGTAVAWSDNGGMPRWDAFAAALVASILIQIGTNLANDYSDARRGADSADRLGPVRVTSAGLVTPRRVLHATWLAFGLAGLIGLYLAWLAGPVILLVGAVSIAAGALYTGGPRPYGYAGLGEVFVFIFFGLVAVNGSYYVQLEALDWGAFGLSVTVGFLSTAILVVNNVRDIDSDRRAGKNTLAVRIGREKTRAVYWACMNLGIAALLLTIVLDQSLEGAAFGVIAIAFAVRPLRTVQTRTDGPSLNQALADTGLVLGVFALASSIGLVIFS
jgi:1,4-dihydroxy-2-naphthoate octaprenyltransferase